jgi:sugar diacid utilization regulator
MDNAIRTDRVEEIGPPRSDGDRHVTTLRQLHKALGPNLIEVLAAPGGVDVPIHDVLLHDQHSSLGSEDAAEKLLLAVGSTADDGTLGSAMRQVAGTGAVGVAGRIGTAPSSHLLRTAEETGLALISVPDHVSWDEFYGLIRATIVVGDSDLEEDDKPISARGVVAGDLFAIAEATAALAGGPVYIDDIKSRVLAFSTGGETDQARRTTILNRRPTDECLRAMRQEGVIDHLLTSDEILRFDFEDPESPQPRRVIAIRGQQRLLGSIWLMGEDDTLSPEADEALRRAAPIAALHLMRQRVHDDIERRMREHSLATMLDGGELPAAALNLLDLPGDEQLVVLAIEATAHAAHSPVSIGPRLIDLLTVQLRAYERPAVATSLDEKIYVLTGSRGAEDRASLRRIAKECRVHAAKVLGVELRSGIGHEVGSASELAVARRSADDCLALASGSEREVLFEEIRSKVLLADVEQMVTGWHGGQSTAVQELIEHDREHRTEYLGTLRSVLDNFGNAAKAAKELHLHVNTVRYRIRRITELTGVDLFDGDARLAIELELRALPVQQALQPARDQPST